MSIFFMVHLVVVPVDHVHEHSNWVILGDTQHPCIYCSMKQSKQALSEATVKTGAALSAFGTATANKWTELK